MSLPDRRVVAAFAHGDHGSFAESMALDTRGDLIVSLTSWGSEDETSTESNSGELWRVSPEGDTRLEASTDLGPNGVLMGVALDSDGVVHVAVFDASPEEALPDGDGSGVLRLTASGELARVVSLPPGSWPNGIAFHGGRLFIADSRLGAVWRVRVDAVVAPTEPWVRHPLLEPSAAASAVGIGANGVAFRGDTLLVAVSDAGRIVCVHPTPTDTPGPVEVVASTAELVTVDGVSVAGDGGVWAVTNGAGGGSGGIWRLPGGDRVVEVATNAPWLNYPTTLAFGAADAGDLTLFVLNGAFHGPADGSAPTIVALPCAGLLQGADHHGEQ